MPLFGWPMITSTTFHSNSIRQITQVFVFPFRIRNRIVNLNYLGISLCFHINWVITTMFCYCSGIGGVNSPSSRYAT